MAKKRVHEIAKEHGVSSKDVLAALAAAGIEAKAAASSVEETDALKALSAAGGGAPSATATKPPAPTADGKAAAGDGKPAAAKAAGAAAQRPARTDGAGAAAGAGAAKTGSGKKRRRVVIDSQAARRDQMGGPPPQRPPRRRGGRRRRPLLEEPPPKPVEVAEPEATKVPSGATVREVAELLGLGSAEVIKKLMEMGEMATLTQTLTDESIRAIAGAHDRKIEIVHAADEEPEAPAFDDSDEELEDRPPVVTIMGHVDHGKTSLLDAIRETEVVAGEAGGITQHIGAYQVHHGDNTITFLDTPGHAAFTAMRARGARVTDVAVIVVAADDGVMPQTKEAIDHARAADVPILIAVNKIDKEGAQPDRVRNELASDGLTPEDWGGETVYVDVSAKTKEGLDSLLDMIILVSELEELGANPNTEASGNVIESQLDPGRGPVVSVLVQRGTLRVGDSVVAGPQWGRVRAMHDFMGDRVEEAVPGMPVEVLGFDGVVEAGEFVQVVDNDRRAREMAQERANRLKTEALARRQARKVTLEEVFARAQEGDIKELNIVLKADVAGSLGALQDEIAKAPQERVTINIIHAQTGGINESDVMLAAASDAVIIGFNVRPLADARRAAEQEGIDIRTYSVIYKVTEELRAAMEGMLEAVEVEETIGEAEVKETFRASRVGNIAGCIVNEGRVTRDANIRLIRDGTVVWTGRVGSLRRFKDDVREVDAGQECGIVLEGYGDVKVGDILEAFETRQVEQTLES
ncbi:MAG TPA: translation initiation factor IF-2 [Solirubrobacterales bacterium]|nr:translation initiation factor IF-2 [Solirubrobacterales bacterium]